MRLVVTGGAGFIGAHFVRRVLEEPGVRVLVVDKLSYAADLARLKGLDPDRWELVEHDLVEPGLDLQGADAIVHFAAESHVDRSIDAPSYVVENNVLSTLRLLEACRRQGVHRFHHVSTDEVYGSLASGDPESVEGDAYRPRSPYSASKAASDHLVDAWAHTYGLHVSSTYGSNTYGPGQHAEKFLPVVIDCLSQGQQVPIYGSGGNQREWLHARDHADAIWTVLQQGRGHYNVGGGERLSNLSLAQRVCAWFDREYPSGAPHERLLSFVADRPGHDWRYALNTRAVRALGWAPRVLFDHGLEETIRHRLDGVAIAP